MLIVKTLGRIKDKGLLSIYGNRNIGKEDIIYLKNIMEKCGALNECKDFARKLVVEAIGLLSASNLKDIGKCDLINLANYILEMKS